MLFETRPIDVPGQQVNTVRGFALELTRIHVTASNDHLSCATTATATAKMYWTITDVAASHPELSAWELGHVVERQLDEQAIDRVGEICLRVCDRN